jgi:hypothetical protein
VDIAAKSRPSKAFGKGNCHDERDREQEHTPSCNSVEPPEEDHGMAEMTTGHSTRWVSFRNLKNGPDAGIANAAFHAPCVGNTTDWPTAAKERSPSSVSLAITVIQKYSRYVTHVTLLWREYAHLQAQDISPRGAM